MLPSSQGVRNDAMRRHPKLSETGRDEQCLDMDYSSTRDGIPLADLAVT